MDTVAEIIGCDQPSAPQRLRAAVVRAYAEADFLANFFAEYTRDLRTSARPIALQVRAIVKELQDLLPRGVEILTQWRWESSEEKAGRSEGLKESLSELRTLEQELEGIADSVPQFGRLPEVPRLFFTIRLAEAFALLSGEKPEYHASGWGSADGRVPSRWERFLTAAIEAVALPTGIQGVDGILRKVARNYVVHRRAIGILAEKSATLIEGNWFQEPDDRWRFQPISYGDLQSTGLLIDYHVPLPWERQ